MKCTQCGTDNDSDARFCKKCGGNLAGKPTQPGSTQRGKPGGFYRFCLAAAAIWTCFLVGSFLAMGMGMVRSGVTDPTAFGLGFGLGFVFFAGLWFIATVVLLLLAMVTRPSPPVQWPLPSKVAAASLAILALLWPMVKVARLPLPSTPVTSTTSPLNVGGTRVASADVWQVHEDRSPMDGSKRVVISRDAENDIQGWLRPKRPTLVVRCQEGKTAAYVVTGMAASVEYDTERHTVRLRFDEGNPTTQRWSESTDHEALFAPNPTQLAKQMLGSKALTFQFTPFNASPAIARFNLQGLGSHLQKVASACGWQMPEEPK